MTYPDPDFEQMFIDHYDRLVRSLTVITGDRETARDCVQDAFVKAAARWRKVSRYDDPPAWVRRVAINRSRDVHRAEKRRRRREAVAGWQADDEVPDESYVVDSSVRLAELLGGLPDRQRAVAALFYVDDLSVADIADALDVSTGTVKFHLNKARAALRCAVEQHEGQSDGYWAQPRG